MKTKVTVIRNTPKPDQPAVDRRQYWDHPRLGPHIVMRRADGLYSLIGLEDGRPYYSAVKNPDDVFCGHKDYFTYLPEVTISVGGEAKPEPEPEPAFQVGDKVETLCKWCGIPKGTQGSVLYVDLEGDIKVCFPNFKVNFYPAYCLKKI